MMPGSARGDTGCFLFLLRRVPKIQKSPLDAICSLQKMVRLSSSCGHENSGITDDARFGCCSRSVIRMLMHLDLELGKRFNFIP
jgi:hypothetical protein